MTVTVEMRWVESFEIPGKQTETHQGLGVRGEVYTYDGEQYYRVGMFLYQPEDNVLDFTAAPPYKALHAHGDTLIAEPYTGE